MRCLPIAGAALVLAACREQPAGIASATFPVIDAAAVAANPNNVLSAVVTTRVRFADSVAGQYGAGPSLDNVTPAGVPPGGSAPVPVLGLLPGPPPLFR